MQELSKIELNCQDGRAQSIYIDRMTVLQDVFLECAKTLCVFHSPVKKKV